MYPLLRFHIHTSPAAGVVLGHDQNDRSPPPAAVAAAEEDQMSWFRLRQAPASSLLFRPKSQLPLIGDLVGTGARATASKGDRFVFGPTIERRLLGRHLDGFLGYPRSNTMCIRFLDSELITSTATGCIIPRVCTNCRLIMTQASVAEREVVKAFECFLSTVEDAYISKNEICGIYIESLCRSGNLINAVCLLSYLHHRGINPDLNSYNILLSTANEANSFAIFSEIFKSLLRSNQPPNFTSYVNVLNAFQKLTDSNQLVKFILEISEVTANRDPTVINRIIFLTARSGQIDKSMMIYEKLKNLDLKMDRVTFNTVVVILGRAGQVDQMLSVFSLMKDLGHAPDIVTYNTLINCSRRLGRLDLCKAFAGDMFENGIEFDLRTYTALIDAFGRAGHVEDALRIFDEMKKSQCPSIYVYRALINDLKKAGKYELAQSIQEEMNVSTSKLIGPADFKKRNGRKKPR